MTAFGSTRLDEITTEDVQRLKAALTLVKAAQSDPLALQLVLLGGEAGLRCGEMTALEWSDVDLIHKAGGRRAFMADDRLNAFIPARSALTRASFFARVQPLICRSRARASSIDDRSSEYTSVTGRRAAVY